MRNFSLFFTRIAVVIAILAAGSYGQSLDTLSATEVAPGIVHFSILAPGLPLTINVVKANLKMNGVALRVVKASKNGRETLDARERTSMMMEEANTDSTLAVAAVNGGFFDVVNGRPMDLQIENGMIGKLNELYPVRSEFLYSHDGKAVIGRFELNIALAARDTTYRIDDVNEVCRDDQVILFDRFYGNRSGTNLYGLGIVLRPLGNPDVGGKMNCIADTVITLSGNYKIPKSGLVLVARGAARTALLRMVTTGDTVRLITRFTPKLDGITQALAGWPGIVRNGENVAASESKAEETIPGFSENRHPRTAVGISKDGSTVILAVVDGRTTKSIGVTLPELAKLMLKFGAYYALNLDGGGSSTMAIKGKVVNSPSDKAGERPVSDALVITVRN